MKYEPIPEFDREEILRQLKSGNENEENIVLAILSAALHDDDWLWAQNICLKGLGHANFVIKRAGLIGLSHVVRLHGRLDLDVVAKKLSPYREAHELSGYVENLFSDINIYHRPQSEN
ncbi:hypothetical protein G6N74_17350 [Mesorhizobium sp. CGMCC 1.15528]|uniref:HEAT repeat domain-containing protein n=1 Tax=Mesorhizobium zhangyense TaxID=1776730 RepID=A0A7C9R924_9HYPH|nr:hypothetical protein [Mesorhizobium zhangyense]NGN42839.1 hypothetical protein [Mesorhizobium zhangyense]